jgi:hypothetical protein
MYQRVKELFDDGWQHHDRTYNIKAIYTINKVLLENGLNIQGYEILFHGTRRACYIGQNDQFLKPCSRHQCNLCCILRESFDVEKSGQCEIIQLDLQFPDICNLERGMLGKGV